MIRKLEFSVEVKQIRLLNMNYLIETVKSVDEFALLVDSPASYISQIRSDKTDKQVGDKLARKIETAFNKPLGWMDKLQFEDPSSLESISDTEALELAVHHILNRLVRSGVYKVEKQIENSIVSSMIIDEYEQILNKRKEQSARSKSAG